MNAAVIGLVVILLGLQGLTSKKKKKKKPSGDERNPMRPGGGRIPDGGGGDADDDDGEYPGGGNRDNAWEDCATGWFIDAGSGDIVCEDFDNGDAPPDAFFVTHDCGLIIEGEDFFDKLAAAAVLWMEYDFKNFGNITAAMRELLVYPSDDGEEDYAVPECIALWPYFLAMELDVPGGDWDYESEGGYEKFLEYFDWYEATYPVMNAFLFDLDSRLANDSEVGPILDAWNEQYGGGDWTFDPGGSE